MKVENIYRHSMVAVFIIFATFLVLLAGCQAKEVRQEEPLQAFTWELENKFPEGLRLIVALNQSSAFSPDFEASSLEIKISDTFWRTIPKVDPENPNSGEMVFVLNGKESFHTWTQVDNGTITIVDIGGNKTALEIGPFTYRDPRFTWDEEESKNFKVLFYGSVSSLHPETILHEGERLLKKFSYIPSRKIRIIVYETRQDIDVALPFRSKGTREELITLGMAFSDMNAVLVLRADGFFDTIRHELMHLIFDHLTEKAIVPLPAWLNEGLAMYAGSEDLSREEKYSISLAIENGKFLSLRQLTSFSGRSELVSLNYAEAHSFVRFLIKSYGQDKMASFLSFLNNNFGMAIEEATEKVYGKTLEVLEKEWKGKWLPTS